LARKTLPLPANDNGGLIARLKGALPGWRDALYGALCWGLAMAASAQVAMWNTNRAETFHFWSLSFLYLFGAALAWPLALMLVRFFALGRRAETWFCAVLVFLSTATIGVTASLFALIYRIFYSQWHSEAFSTPWFYQQIFTTASAFYQFAVMGLRLYLPFGALALLAVALVVARRRARNVKRKPVRRFSTT
jgi:hypothetical protein